MSGKTIKKSDRGKGWMKARQNRNFIINPLHYLIVSEGTKTEPEYFKALAQKVGEGTALPARRRREFIRFHIECVGKNPKAVFEKAQIRAAEIERNERIRVSKVWVVFDKDDFSEEEFNSIESLCSAQCGTDIDYYALWSNECIELWFLLHFEYCNSAISREGYYKKLSKHLKDLGYPAEYKKNCPDLFDWLYPRLQTAKNNARRLLDTYSPNTAPSKKNPATTVFLLLEELNPYL